MRQAVSWYLIFRDFRRDPRKPLQVAALHFQIMLCWYIKNTAQLCNSEEVGVLLDLGAFLVSEDSCCMQRSDKGMGVWPLWPFYGPLRAMNRSAVSPASVCSPTGSSADFCAHNLLLQKTQNYWRAVYVNILSPQKRTVFLMTNWVKSHLAWSK